MKLLILLPVILTLVFFVPQSSYGHQDGCHRWHSCPSDSGSYVCGDLGYATYCPVKKTTPDKSQLIDNNIVKPINSLWEKWSNLRGEMVSVFPSSVDTLIERGYLLAR